MWKCHCFWTAHIFETWTNLYDFWHTSALFCCYIQGVGILFELTDISAAEYSSPVFRTNPNPATHGTCYNIFQDSPLRVLSKIMIRNVARIFVQRLGFLFDVVMKWLCTRGTTLKKTLKQCSLIWTSILSSFPKSLTPFWPLKCREGSCIAWLPTHPDDLRSFVTRTKGADQEQEHRFPSRVETKASRPQHCNHNTVILSERSIQERRQAITKTHRFVLISFF